MTLVWSLHNVYIYQNIITDPVNMHNFLCQIKVKQKKMYPILGIIMRGLVDVDQEIFPNRQDQYINKP